MYSQNNEEQYIVEYFKNFTGTFVDIGGYDVFKFSNTRKLYESGFSGAYVEPSKICFQSFLNEYSNEPRIQLFNIAIGTSTGKIKFYESNGDALSTTSTEHLKKWNKVKFTETEVDLLEINEFLNRFKQIDFLSIDVESTNLELFNKITDFNLNRIKMLCIEHDSNQEYIYNRMKSLGFKVLLTNGENIILAK